MILSIGHLQLQSSEQATLTFAHVQLEQSPIQLHLTSSRQALESSGILIQTGTHMLDLVQENSSGERITCCACKLVVQIPA